MVTEIAEFAEKRGEEKSDTQSQQRGRGDSGDGEAGKKSERVLTTEDTESTE